MSVGKIGKFIAALGCLGYALNCCLSFAFPMFGIPTHSFSIGGVLISLSFYCGYICMICGFGLLLFSRKDTAGILMAALAVLAFLSVLITNWLVRNPALSGEQYRTVLLLRSLIYLMPQAGMLIAAFKDGKASAAALMIFAIMVTLLMVNSFMLRFLWIQIGIPSRIASIIVSLCYLARGGAETATCLSLDE